MAETYRGGSGMSDTCQARHAMTGRMAIECVMATIHHLDKDLLHGITILVAGHIVLPLPLEQVQLVTYAPA